MDDFYARPLITPESVELAVQVGADDTRSLLHLFGIAGIGDRDHIETLYDGLAVLVEIGRLTSHVDHAGTIPRTVYVPTGKLNFTGGVR